MDNTKLLIVDEDAVYIKKALARKFPELTIHAAAREEDAGDFIEKAEILAVKMISDGLMQKARKLKWIHTLITGVDYILNLPSLKKEVLLTSTKGIHGPQMSELAFLLMLSLNRKLSRVLRNQDKSVWERWPGILLYRKKVGILGVGVIGKELARKCKAFEMTVFGITSVKRTIAHVDHSYGPEDLLEVMGEVDYFINILPNTPETRNMIGAREFAAMKPTAYFINIGRGETVDEGALVEALEGKKIAGAGLDVFCTEPLPPEHPLWGLDNVIITPHIGGMSDIYADQTLPIFEENLRRFLKGERQDLVNFIER